MGEEVVFDKAMANNLKVFLMRSNMSGQEVEAWQSLYDFADAVLNGSAERYVLAPPVPTLVASSGPTSAGPSTGQQSNFED